MRLFFLFLLFATSAMAQEVYTPTAEQYRIEYREQHYLRRNDDVLHFVKVNFEWPVTMCYGQLLPLQRFLTLHLFGREDTSPRHALEHYLDSLGAPLTQVPDGLSCRTYYTTLDLTALEYVRDRYLSMRIVNLCEPKDTAEQVRETQTIFTYDLVNDRVLTAKELLKASARRQYDSNWWELTSAILDGVANNRESDGEGLYEVWHDACMMRVGMVFDVGQTGEELYHQLAIVPTREVRPYLSKEAKALIDQAPPVRDVPHGLPVQQIADTTLIYTIAEEEPTMRGFGAATAEMLRYLAANVRYPELERMLSIDGRVVVRFVVEKDGSVSNTAVVRPVSPGLDREAIRVVRMMPRWQPGRVGGQPVRTLVTLPVTYKMG